MQKKITQGLSLVDNLFSEFLSHILESAIKFESEKSQSVEEQVHTISFLLYFSQSRCMMRMS